MITAMPNAVYLRLLREEASANGLCNECRCRPAEHPFRTCRVCLDKHADRKKRFFERGLCKCGRERKPGLKFCANCSKSDSQRKRYAAGRQPT